MNTILGISAKAGCGKTTLCNMLLERLGPDWIRMSLGDGVKREAAELFNFPIDWCYSQEGKERMVPGVNRLVRELLQYHGTDVRRAADPEYWNNYLLRVMPAGGNVIIDDSRFPNEVEFISRIGGRVIRLLPYVGYQAPTVGADHLSETALDDYTGFDAVYAPRFGGLGDVVEALTGIA